MENELRTSSSTDGSTSIFDDEIHFEHASKGIRLANYLIDLVTFAGFMILLGIVLGIFYPSALDWFDTLSENPFADRLFSL